LTQVQILEVRGSNPCLTQFRAVLQYHCNKSACVSCPPGYGVLKQCNGSTSTVCEPCVAGVNFSNTNNPYEICLPVGMCSENRVVDIPATPEHDVKCKCKDGFMENFEGFCVPLLFKPQSRTSPAIISQFTMTSTQRKSTPTTKTPETTIASSTNHPMVSPLSSVVEVVVVVTNATLLPGHTKHPFSHNISLKPSTIDHGMMSTVYIAIGGCIFVIVLITTTVICYHYCCCLRYITWRGKRERFIVDRQGECKSPLFMSMASHSGIICRTFNFLFKV
jgi:hypothetical protein